MTDVDLYDSAYGHCTLPVYHEDLFRVLNPSGTLLFRDAVLIGGLISHDGIGTRSSMGSIF